MALEEVSKLLQAKKITKDNAFDVNIEEQIGIENMRDFLTRQARLDTKWLKTGEALGAGTKIYGYRVENVYLNAHKMIFSLARNENGEEILEIIHNNDDEENADEMSPQ